MAVAVPYIAKAVVGFAVGKLVAEVTGNEVLGMIAGGFAGGGLNFNTGSGFSWSLAGPSAAVNTGTAGAAELLGTMPGGATLLNGTGDALFGNLAGGAEMMGADGLVSGAADLMGGAVSNGGGAAGILGDPFAKGLADVGSSIMASPGGQAPSVLDGIFKGVNESAGYLDPMKNSPYAVNNTAKPEGSVFGQTSSAKVTGAQTEAAKAAATKPGTATSGGGVASESSGGLFDKVDRFMKDHDWAANMAMKGVSAMMEPDPEDLYRERANIERDFQTQGFDADRLRTDSDPNLPDRMQNLQDVYGYGPTYSRQVNPNYRQIIQRIRDQRSNRQEVA